MTTLKVIPEWVAQTDNNIQTTALGLSIQFLHEAKLNLYCLSTREYVFLLA
jgi:hypothetical protein